MCDAIERLAFSPDPHALIIRSHCKHALHIAREVDFPGDRVLNVTPRRLPGFSERRSGKPVAELADF
ncbi:histidinol-phosphatase [Pantoea sp. C2G6]|uniref:histidinol-phosphatase n=1 Tax=Pantoea sp. C2G6 TaxID=3243084 RepID=UPI003F50FE8E